VNGRSFSAKTVINNPKGLGLGPVVSSAGPLGRQRPFGQALIVYSHISRINRTAKLSILRVLPPEQRFASKPTTGYKVLEPRIRFTRPPFSKC